MYGPADPTSLLLNTLAHNGGSVTQAPNLLLPSPQKQETGIGQALVFLLISCFAAPSPDYFLYFFWFLSGWTYLINFLSSGNKLLWCSHEAKGVNTGYWIYCTFETFEIFPFKPGQSAPDGPLTLLFYGSNEQGPKLSSL